MLDRSRVAIGLLLAGIAQTPAPAQTPALELARPDAVAAEPFSLVRGARELPDGRLLVTDWIEQRIAIVDFARTTVEDRARVGAGPREFRLPGALHPWRGDSTLLVDVGNARLAVLDADGRIVRTFTPDAPGAAAAGGADGNGNVYHVIPPWLARPPLPDDSVDLAVLEANGRSRVVTRIKGSTRPPPGSPELGPRVPFVVFARQDGWASAADGRIAVVRGNDYGITWIAGGRATRTPGRELRPRPVRPEDRTAFVRRFLQGSAMSGRGEGGGLGHVPADALSDEGVARTVRASTFAETLPPFQPGSVRIDPAGRVWVARWTRAGERALLDVIDERGRTLAEIRLPAERELIAVGEHGIYLVQTGADGLQTIERYAVPEGLQTGRRVQTRTTPHE